MSNWDTELRVIYRQVESFRQVFDNLGNVFDRFSTWDNRLGYKFGLLWVNWTFVLLGYIKYPKYPIRIVGTFGDAHNG